MNWEAIGAIGEVVGVFAIIASLIYVAAQIRQNNSIARATIIHETNSDATRIAELLAQDSELAAIYHKGTSGESMSGIELVRYLALVEIYLAWLEDVDSQFEADLYFKYKELEDVVDYNSADVVLLFSTVESRQWWHDNVRRLYRPSFANKVDKYVDPA